MLICFSCLFHNFVCFPVFFVLVVCFKFFWFVNYEWICPQFIMKPIPFRSYDLYLTFYMWKMRMGLKGSHECDCDDNDWIRMGCILKDQRKEKEIMKLAIYQVISNDFFPHSKSFILFVCPISLHSLARSLSAISNRENSRNEFICACGCVCFIFIDLARMPTHAHIYLYNEYARHVNLI